MGKRYLLDTNAILDFMGDKLPLKSKITVSKIIDEEINISVINKIELLGFANLDQDLVDFVNCSNIYSLSDEVVDKAIEIRKLFKIKLPDAIIAATAIQYSFSLVTNNIRDFIKISELNVINPHKM